METPVKKNGVSDLQNGPWNQSPMIFTSPGGNVSTKGKGRAHTKDGKENEDVHVDGNPGGDLAEAKGITSVNVTVTSTIHLPRLSTTRLTSQITPLRTSNRQDDTLFPFTPCFVKKPQTTISKYTRNTNTETPAHCRPPLSSIKLAKRNIMGELGRSIDFGGSFRPMSSRKELGVSSRGDLGVSSRLDLGLSSRTKTNRRESFMDRQERLFVEWLNFTLKQKVPGAGKSRSESGARMKNGTKEVDTTSLQALAPIPELRKRLLSRTDSCVCEEIISAMSLVSKRIDEGKLRMKEGYAVFADVGLRKKAMEVLLSYSPTWLNTGLEIVLGFSSGCTTSAGLDVFLEKQFFVHPVIAREYSTNKSVEGLYRHGYLEALGRIILKRLLLLVLAVDKIKCANTLDPEDGIDGLDGGSALLFQKSSTIKSSRQGLQELLMDAMYGEGDLLAHLGTLGYRLHHVQAPLADYVLEVTTLPDDLQDGVRLCRLAQVLTGDSSLLRKLRLPATSKKQHNHNCNVALQYLEMSGVSLLDEQGFPICSEDIVYGDREKVFFLLWTAIRELQMPKLLDTAMDELCRIDDIPEKENVPDIQKLLLKWIKKICERYEYEVGGFGTSLKDGQALCYILNFYLPEHVPRECIVSGSKVSEDGAAHNFALVSAITRKLEFIPDLDLILWDKLGELRGQSRMWTERNVLMFLVFLCSKLIGSGLEATRRVLDQNPLSKYEQAATRIQAHYRSWVQRSSYKKRLWGVKNIQRIAKGRVVRQQFLKKKRAARVIQQYWRKKRAREELKRSSAASVIQASYRAHASRQHKHASKLQAAWRGYVERNKYLHRRAAVVRIQQRWRLLLEERGAAAIVIQAFYRRWIQRRRYCKIITGVRRIQSALRRHIAARKKEAAVQIQRSWRALIDARNSKAEAFRRGNAAATVIQAHIRRWNQWRKYREVLAGVERIQASWRVYMAAKDFRRKKAAAVRIQRSWRAFAARRRGNLLGKSFQRQRGAAIVVQKYFRKWLARTAFLRDMERMILVQAFFRSRSCRKRFVLARDAACCIQTHFRRSVIQRKALRAALSAKAAQERSATTIQNAFREWRRRKCEDRKAQQMEDEAGSTHDTGISADDATPTAHMELAAMCIQRHYRGWKIRNSIKRKEQAIKLMQAYWRGHLARKEQNEHIQALRLRIQNSATTADENMTLGNRLNEALALLLGFKTVSGILHICATIEMATRHSKYCCERIADGGAIVKLVQLIQTTNRSTPHEQVLKHALSILGNLARYVPLARRIIETPRCLDVIAEQLQMCRNKEDIFFKAMHVLEAVAKTAPEEFRRSGNLISRRLQHVKILLDNKVQVEQRILERLTKGTPLPTKMAAQRKLNDAKSQLQGVALLLKASTTETRTHNDLKRRR